MNPTVYDLLQRAVRGEIDVERAASVEDAVREAKAEARQALGMSATANFDDAFWNTAEGDLIARADNWLYGPDLITQTQAAMILYGLTEEQAKGRGNHRALINLFQFPANAQPPKLERFWKPGERYPIRLHRVQVEELRRMRDAGELMPGPKPKKPVKRTPRYEPPLHD